jgi:hypothetical protein
MGATCFCGCGRTIPLRHLSQRSHNNAGHEVVKQLSWLRDGLAEAGATPDAEEQRWLDEGDDIVKVLARAAHGELKRPNLAAVAEWRKEGRAAEREQKSRQFQTKLAFGHMVREGADPVEAAEAVLGKPIGEPDEPEQRP